MGRNVFNVPKSLIPNLPQDILCDPGASCTCVFGFDRPCGGYFIQIFIELTQDLLEKYDNHPNFNGEVFSIEDIGFFLGVNKNRILEIFEKYKIVELVKTLKRDAFSNLCLDLPC